VLRALLDNVREQIKTNDLALDFIALTGDIAFQSKPEEDELAPQFFDDLIFLISASSSIKEMTLIGPWHFGQHSGSI
jgi:hypothetical protein